MSIMRTKCGTELKERNDSISMELVYQLLLQQIDSVLIFDDVVVSAELVIFDDQDLIVHR